MEKFTCNKCKKMKPAADFDKEKRNKTGITGRCKACRCAIRKENGELLRERIRKYQIKLGKKELFLTVDQVRQLLEKPNCAYCGCKMDGASGTPTEATLDHVYGLSGYGSGSSYMHLMACCRSCNASKGDSHVADYHRRSEKFTPELFRQFAGEYTSRLLQRELTELEAAEMARNFLYEADMLRRNAEKKERAAE